MTRVWLGQPFRYLTKVKGRDSYVPAMRCRRWKNAAWFDLLIVVFLKLNLITFQDLNLNEVAELQPAETTRWNEQERFWNERWKQKKNSRSKRDSLISRSRLTIIIIIAIIIISIASYFLLFLFFFDVSKCVEDTCGKHQLKIVSELWLKKYSC